ncbi:unnamed protein product, partial [Rotaria sp. Silwood2]
MITGIRPLELAGPVTIAQEADGNLVVKVTETPFITKVILQGNSKIKSAQLTKELFTVAGDAISPGKIQLDAEKIKEIYKRSGRLSTM